jgi:competence protein ComEC
MVEQGRSRGRTAAWRPASPVGKKATLAWPAGLADLARAAAHCVREWVAIEAGPGRLLPWLAIAFGSGIILYFSVSREPAPWAVALLLVATVAAAILLRHRSLAFATALGVASVAAGFGCATFKRAIIAHPVLSTPIWNAELAGFVIARQERERSDRITLNLVRIDAPRLEQKLERVRVSVRKGTAPPVGSFVEFKARLSPPLEPLRPGGYDYARDMYFQSIG